MTQVIYLALNLEFRFMIFSSILLCLRGSKSSDISYLSFSISCLHLSAKPTEIRLIVTRLIESSEIEVENSLQCKVKALCLEVPVQGSDS